MPDTEKKLGEEKSPFDNLDELINRLNRTAKNYIIIRGKKVPRVIVEEVIGKKFPELYMQVIRNLIKSGEEINSKEVYNDLKRYGLIKPTSDAEEYFSKKN